MYITRRSGDETRRMKDIKLDAAERLVNRECMQSVWVVPGRGGVM